MCAQVIFFSFLLVTVGEDPDATENSHGTDHTVRSGHLALLRQLLLSSPHARGRGVKPPPLWRWCGARTAYPLAVRTGDR
jgi:hypothetical protein